MTALYEKMRLENMKHYGFGPEVMKSIKVCKECGAKANSDLLFCPECDTPLPTKTLYMLPVALFPDKNYDNNGCWSGTAMVKDDTLYLFYASVQGEEKIQTVSVAYSTDGIHFEKYSKNPVIEHYPADGGPDFRDPAVCNIDRQFKL